MKREFNRTESARRNAAKKSAEKKRSGDRLLVDPATCDREYSADEVEFMMALDAYKRRWNRPFPTCSETLEVLKSLGYHK